MVLDIHKILYLKKKMFDNRKLISYGIVRYNINQLSNMKYDIAFYDTKQYCVI